MSCRTLQEALHHGETLGTRRKDPISQGGNLRVLRGNQVASVNMRRTTQSPSGGHGALAYPDRNGVTIPEAGSKRCRQTHAVSLASR